MKILITGGAGFIGSNLCGALLQHPAVTLVRVFDNFATGYRENLQPFLQHPKFELLEGDIRHAADCAAAVEGIDAISHQAALGSVPRSIADPATSHDVNLNGFVNMLQAANKAGIRRMVYASSSSVYGDLPDSPKVETRVGKVLSPYAATKYANEIYAQAWSKSYGMQLVGFRYFNVFGPNQSFNGPYAAVIPLFIRAALTNTSPTINGDGNITRDFTPVKNVVQANINSLLLERTEGFHEVLNIACGKTTTLNDLWQKICRITGATVAVTHGPNRPGDIMQSLADVSKAKQTIGYTPDDDLDGQLAEAIEWYRSIL